MKKDKAILVLLIVILVIVASFFVIKLAFQNRGIVQTNQTDTLSTATSTSELSWEKYTSNQLGISFEYPEEWTVVPLSALTGDLHIVPPPSKLINTGKILEANMIIFYTKDQVLNPGSDENGEKIEIFSRLDQYIHSTDTLKDFRILSPSNNIDAVGIYRDGNNMVGLYQQMCYYKTNGDLDKQQKLAGCDEIFKHILYSIQFVK
jgi:hypothetical protein